MKVLVVGCGSIGERHIRNLKSLDMEEIFACDRDQERLEFIRNEYGIKTFHDYEEAASREAINAAIVCTPTSNHVAPALFAIRQGWHVFVEKPLSHTLDGVDDLIKEARRKNVTLMAGFNLRFHPNLQQIKKLLDGEAIGRIISARSHFGFHFLGRLPYHHWTDYREDYAAKRIGGGVILDAATHHIDVLNWFMGNIKEVFCYSEKAGGLDLEAEDIAEILLKFESGAMASLHVNFIQQPYQNKCEIIGDKGTITWDFTSNIVNLFSATDDRWQTFPENNFDHNETYVQEMVHFMKCIHGEEEPPVDGIGGKTILEVALAARKSAETGKIITV